MTKKKGNSETGYRPGSVGYYLTQRGWEPVTSEGQFPLWRKGNNAPVQAKEALYEVYREIWRECRPKAFH
jgi:hypothetical protein